MHMELEASWLLALACGVQGLNAPPSRRLTASARAGDSLSPDLAGRRPASCPPPCPGNRRRRSCTASGRCPAAGSRCNGRTPAGGRRGAL
eukprot:scaffold29312_cov112-Isochrysis_galbana.AAC.2